MSKTKTDERRPAKKLDVSADDLRRWELQPRKHFDAVKHKELMSSVSTHGVMQSLIVRYTDEEGVFEIVCGERRWRAAAAASVYPIPVSVRHLTDKEAMELAMVENVQRHDLDVFEEAAGYQALIQLGFSVAEMSQRFKRAKTFIYSRIELLKLGEVEREAVVDGNISIRVAEGLSRIENDDARAEALGHIVKPSHHSESLPQDAALRLLKHDYIDPQADAKAWEKSRKEVEKEFPAADVLGYDNDFSFGCWKSPYVDAESKPARWDVVDRLQEDEDSIPTWGELGKRYGAQLYILPPEERGGDPIAVVEKQPLIDADVAQAKGKKAVFPKPEAADETKADKQASERAKAEAEAADARKREQRKKLVMAIKYKNLSPLVDMYMEESYAEYDNFESLYNLIHDDQVEGDNDEDLEKRHGWIKSQVKGKGVKELFWLIIADSISGRYYQSIEEGKVIEAMGLDAADYPDLVSEKGEGDERV